MAPMTSAKMPGYELRSRVLVLLTGLAASLALRPAASQEAASYGQGESKPIPKIVTAVRQQDHGRVASMLANGADPSVLSGSSGAKSGPSAWVQPRFSQKGALPEALGFPALFESKAGLSTSRASAAAANPPP